jgi:hypothetical protein
MTLQRHETADRTLIPLKVIPRFTSIIPKGIFGARLGKIRVFFHPHRFGYKTGRVCAKRKRQGI